MSDTSSIALHSINLTSTPSADRRRRNPQRFAAPDDQAFEVGRPYGLAATDLARSTRTEIGSQKDDDSAFRGSRECQRFAFQAKRSLLDKLRHRKTDWINAHPLAEIHRDSSPWSCLRSWVSRVDAKLGIFIVAAKMISIKSTSDNIGIDSNRRVKNEV